MLKKVAVLGGGNGSHTMAADLTLKGLEVRLCEAPEFKDAFVTTLKTGRPSSAGRGTTPPSILPAYSKRRG
jgi:opine dehydrogenase